MTGRFRRSSQVSDAVEVIRADDVDGGEGVVALIVWGEVEIAAGVRFYTPPESNIQYARMVYPPGHVVPRHRHLPVRGRMAEQTQEVLFVRDGLVKLDLYDSAGRGCGSYLLRAGDAAVLLAGAHRLEAVTAAAVEEVKTGPYPGREFDKEEMPEELP